VADKNEKPKNAGKTTNVSSRTQSICVKFNAEFHTMLCKSYCSIVLYGTGIHFLQRAGLITVLLWTQASRITGHGQGANLIAKDKDEDVTNGPIGSVRTRTFFQYTWSRST